MTILQIFNRYQNPGGEEASVLRVAETLGTRHKVVRCYFNSGDWATRGGLIESVKQAFLMLYNPASLRRVRREIEELQPDLILLHNLFPVCSAAVLWHVVRSGIPVVQYIHNFRPFSVNGYCWANDHLCDSGLRKNFFPEILAGSWQESRLRTAWYGLVIWGLHLLGAYRRIDHWLAISDFMKRKFVEAGVPEERITTLRHSWCAGPDPSKPPAAKPESTPYMLYLGRLSREKGVDTLLEAWESLSPSPGKLIIGGEGPLRGAVNVRQSKCGSIEYRGLVSGGDKARLLDGATALAVPSRWWEPLGIVVYEAYDHAKPVLAAASGGLTEIVIDGQTGMLHQPGDSAQLAAHIRRVMENPAMVAEMGRAGRKHLLETTRPDAWLDTIDSLLLEVAGRRQGDRPPPEAEGQKSEIGDQRSRACSSGVSSSHDDISVAPTVTDRRYKADGGRSEPHSLPTPLVTNGRTWPARPIRPSTGSDPRSTISVSVYLADQNPGHDRSFGISRMSQVVLEALLASGGVSLETISSRTSQQAPAGVHAAHVLPWGTRRKCTRLLTDHFHPLFRNDDEAPDVYYFPKGYLPWWCHSSRPSVVTIHDTIIQYDEDRYPRWRKRGEYAYWAWMLKHTLRNADRILTVSESSRKQIEAFMDRHGIPPKEITVTYEPCQYEVIAQPETNGKENYVIHLASREPHKRTAHLVRWWHEAEQQDRKMPMLHLVGNMPADVEPLLAKSRSIVKRPFLDEGALQAAYRSARALILPSEIEGFGLPALEAYYLGTPVCYVKGTSVEEVLGVATGKGGFSLEDPESLFAALNEVMAMEAGEIRRCGLLLRKTYAAQKVAERMIGAFHEMIQPR